ncbi:MAG: zf-HC2 domain-containing protein [Candidatus Omnitrophica bacterium]|nr:zf-HC2 domain-containing protein [Candidatus Omnitrophota bacterium]
MDCQTIKQELVAFLDNEVSATLKAEIEAHLKGCPDCAQEMRALQASWQMLDRNLPPAPGPDFTASVMRCVHQEPSSSGESKTDWMERLLPSFIIGAVILIALLAGLVMWDHLRPHVKTPEVQLPTPAGESEVMSPAQETKAVVREVQAPVETKTPALVVIPESQSVQPLPEIKPVVVPQMAPMVPVVAVPVIAKVNNDRDIIANLDMYENADMLKKMDVVSDMDVVAAMKEKTS